MMARTASSRCFGIGREKQDRRNAGRARREPRGAASCSPASRADGKILGMDQPAASPDTPAVGEARPSDASRPWRGGRTRSPRRSSASALGGKVDLDRPPEGRIVEDDRLLRQPGEPPAGADRHAAVDLGDAGRGAVDLLAGLRRHRRRRAVADRDRPVEAVAAGKPAGRVDQHGLQRIAERSRHPDLGGAFLVEALDPRAPAGRAARRARRAPRRAGHRAPLRAGVHGSHAAAMPVRGTVASLDLADFGCCFAAIWFLYSQMPVFPESRVRPAQSRVARLAKPAERSYRQWILGRQIQERQISGNACNGRSAGNRDYREDKSARRA